MIRILLYLSLLLASGACLSGGLTLADLDSQSLSAAVDGGSSANGDGFNATADEDSEPWLAPELVFVLPAADVQRAAADVAAPVAVCSAAPPIRAPPLA